MHTGMKPGLKSLKNSLPFAQYDAFSLAVAVLLPLKSASRLEPSFPGSNYYI